MEKIYIKLKNIINNQRWIADLLYILQFTNITEKQENILIDIYKNNYPFWIQPHNIKTEIWNINFDEKKYINSYSLSLT